jgi:peroxiredoxin
MRYQPRSSATGASDSRRPDLEGKPMPTHRFKCADGGTLDLRDIQQRGKRVLFVVLRGFSGQVCVYCVAQTKALGDCKQEFADLGIEVVVVYPGPEGNEKSFLMAYEITFEEGPPPYAVLYDPNLELVTALGLQGGDLAYPSTFLLDEQGIIRYAYVGQHKADRPAAAALTKFIRSLGK